MLERVAFSFKYVLIEGGSGFQVEEVSNVQPELCFLCSQVSKQIIHIFGLGLFLNGKAWLFVGHP